MARLIDRLAGRQSRAAVSTSYDYATVMSQSWGKPETESVLPDFPSFASVGYAGNSVIFALVGARLSLFSQAEFKYQRLADRKLWGSEALSVLENPWPGGTTGELLARMEQDVSLAGNSFVRRWPDRLERLRPDWVDIVHRDVVEDGPDEVIGYIYWSDGRGGGEAEFIPVESVAHWSPVPDPLAEFRGMSWLTPVVREINADLAMTEHRSTFFSNAATPNLVLKYQQKLSRDSLDALRDRWQARYGGPENGWKTAVLDEGADLTVVGSTFESMAFVDVQAAGENRLCMAAGVPPIVIGSKEGLGAATYSNYQQALRAFGLGTMAFLWQSAAAALSKLVDVPADSRLWPDTARIPALRDEETARAEAARTWAVAAGELIRAGYEPQTVANALIAGDMSLLTHTGAIPTALYPNGQAPAAASAPAPRHETVVNFGERSFVAEVDARTTNNVDARTDIADGAIRADIDATTAVLEGAMQVTNTIEAPTPIATRKRVETDDRGRITAITEEPL